MTYSPSLDRPGSERPTGRGRTSGPRPVPGVACPALTNAIRQVERELLKEATRAEQEAIAQLLAAVGLA
ncbi:MAG TPA: hypothetical protein VNI61_03930, partial [Gemmatimonadales bacterium]|nr:hypothetical protein [Gemmatimonadales bacterium]